MLLILSVVGLIICAIPFENLWNIIYHEKYLNSNLELIIYLLFQLGFLISAICFFYFMILQLKSIYSIVPVLAIVHCIIFTFLSMLVIVFQPLYTILQKTGKHLDTSKIKARIFI